VGSHEGHTSLSERQYVCTESVYVCTECMELFHNRLDILH